MNVIPDTMVLFKVCEGTLPEKWQRIWKQTRSGTYRLFLTEPAISELYYRVEKKYGRDSASAKILGLKAMRSELKSEPDKLSFLAADLRVRHKDLSLADSFTVAVAKSCNARLLTTDHKMRDAAEQEGCVVSWLPLGELR